VPTPSQEVHSQGSNWLCQIWEHALLRQGAGLAGDTEWGGLHEIVEDAAWPLGKFTRRLIPANAVQE
jgi:hypothetical protein